MNNRTYTVVFAGQLVDGARPEQVKANFARLFKADIARIAPMFTGKPVVIKKGVDEATAKKYLQVLRQAGALCKAVPSQSSVTRKSETTKGTSSSKPTKPAKTTQTAASAAVAHTPRERSPDVSVSALNATLDEPGVVLIEPENVTPPKVDISHLSMGEVGATLVEPRAESELNVDISRLTMAEPGVIIKESEEVEVPDIDTSRISMS